MVRQDELVLPLLEWCEIAAGSVTIAGVTCDVPAFYMAKYPVTYAQYEAFVNDGGYRNRAHWTDAGWAWKGDTAVPEFWQDSAWHIHDHPINGVTWYEAYAFTRWLSARTRLTISLPTEAQWQRAAQGDDGREYPWGHGFDETRCNTVESAIGRTTPVTQYPNGASPFGVLDMSGNVWECVCRSGRNHIACQKIPPPKAQAFACSGAGPSTSRSATRAQMVVTTPTQAIIATTMGFESCGSSRAEPDQSLPAGLTCPAMGLRPRWAAGVSRRSS